MPPTSKLPMMLSWMQLLYESTCACLLAVATKKSGAWLDALPVSSLSLRMDDNVIQIAVGLCVGLPLCDPPLPAMWDWSWQHGNLWPQLPLQQESPPPSRRDQWYHPEILQICKDPLSPGAHGPIQVRWQEAQWSFHCALEGGQSAGMRCHLSGHPGPLLQCNCCQRSWGSGKQGREEEESQVHPCES